MTDTSGLDALPIEEESDRNPLYASAGTTSANPAQDEPESSPPLTRKLATVLGGIVVLSALGLLGQWVLAGSDSGADDPTVEDSATISAGATISRVGDGTVVADGETVAMRITGFPDAATIAVRQCLEAARLEDPVSARCDTGTTHYVEIAGEPTTVELPVWRELTIAENPVDCVLLSCVVEATDVGTSATAVTTIDFTNTAEASTPPRLAATPTDNLLHNQTIEVTGSDLEPGSFLRFSQCLITPTSTDRTCDASPTLVSGSVEGDGRVEASVPVTRYLIVDGTWYDCAQLDEGECVLVLRTPPSQPALARLPAALPLSFDPTAVDPLGVVELAKSTDLVDGETIVAYLTAAFLGSGDPEVVQCAAGSESMCTPIEIGTLYSDGIEVLATFDVTRRFTAPSGTVHDCVETGPCEIQIWTTTGAPRVLIAPIAFDPTAALRPPTEVTIDTAGPFSDGQTIDVTVASERGQIAGLKQCVADSTERCEVLASTEIRLATASTTVLTATVYRVIVTESGTHDCVSDSGCLIVPQATSDDDFQTVEIVFDPASSVTSELGGVARPRTGLIDGQRVEIRASGATRNVLSVQLCHRDVGQCVHLATLPAADGVGTTQVPIPRIIYTTDTITQPLTEYDCAPDNCWVRIEDHRSILDQAIDFRTDIGPLPAPEIALDTVGPLVAGTQATLFGRGFTFLDTDESDSGLVNVSICGDNVTGYISGDCVPLSRTVSSAGLDGSFAHTFEVPSFDAINLNRPDHPICALECWLIASGAPGLREATLAIALVDAG